MGSAINMILGTTMLILLILLFRKIFWKKCNPNILYFLWLFVALRILLPLHIPLVVQNSYLHNILIHDNSIAADVDILENRFLEDDIPENVFSDTNGQQLNAREDIGNYNISNTYKVVKNGDTEIQEKLNKNDLLNNKKRLLSIIWCSGSLVVSIYFLTGSILAFQNIEKRKVGRFKHKIDVYEVKKYNCLVGIFKPKILISAQVMENAIDRKFVLLHEFEHYKTKDNLWLLIGTICIVVQWFNPFVWIAYFDMQEDCELACDYRVLSSLGKNDKNNYAETLLRILESSQRMVYGISSIGAKRGMEKRMKSIFSKRKKRGFLILIIVLCFATLITFIKLTTDEKDQGISNISRQEQAIDSETESSDISADNYFVESEVESAEHLFSEEGELSENVTQTQNIIYAENLEDIKTIKNFQIADCYVTDTIRAGNHFWIDNQGVLWGTGHSEYGQLGELREDLTTIKEPVLLAENVKHVDFSGEYFMIYITEDNNLYGLGGNPAGILCETSMNDLNSTYMNVITEPILLMENVVYARCGYSSIILLTEKGEVYELGNREYVPFGNNTYQKPHMVMENARYVTSFLNTYAVIDKKDNLWTWGDNRLGQCGVGKYSDQLQTPQKVLENVKCAWMGVVGFNSTAKIRANDNLIALTEDGDFYGCGEGIGNTHLIGGIDDLMEEQEVTASDTFLKIILQEYVPLSVSLKDVELLWTEEMLKQFLNQYEIDYTVGHTDEGNFLIYHANEYTWDLIFNDQGQLAVIESTKCDEMAKDMLVEGDSIEKAIEYYGTNYKQYDLGWGYFIAEYEEEDYDFQIGFYIDDGCVRFSKFLKGFRI